jgi:galactokinase
MNVPTATSLKDIYPSDAIASQTTRWEALLSKFKETYGSPATFVSRSPGRVNLIGEHIDYSLYDVLPMAITADVLLAVLPDSSSKSVVLANVHSEQFPTRTFDISHLGEVHIDSTQHEWSNYFKAGLRGALNTLNTANKTEWSGMKILVDGSVPAGGGLSSSSAFVCASTLAALHAHGETEINKTDLVELAITSERAVGVGGGGMDQAASVCSERGSATYVSFTPKLTVTPVAFPKTTPELAFVIANSYVAADKRVTAPVCYNLRVTECSIAAAVLGKITGLGALPKDSSPLGTSLRGFQDTYFREKEGVEDNSKTGIEEFQNQLETLYTLVKNYLPQEEGYSREEISSILGVPIPDLEKEYMSKFPVEAERFKLRQRALHVFGEATRTIKFRRLLASSAESNTGDDILKELGDLMNKTQDSCRDDYECSCPELDELCELARGVGSYGSRLTGAGWGGGSVHLVAKNKIEQVTKAWVDGYYKKKFPDMTQERLKEAIVVSEPSSGAYLYKVTGNGVL